MITGVREKMVNSKVRWTRIDLNRGVLPGSISFAPLNSDGSSGNCSVTIGYLHQVRHPSGTANMVYKF